MFRRKEEDGSDMTENMTADTPSATPLLDAAGASESVNVRSASAAVPTPNTPATPIAVNTGFRPIPPQAAIAASRPPAAAAAAAQTVATPTPDRVSAKVATKRVLTVGPDIQMKGEITTCDRVVIEGLVDATMREVHTVELAETGALKGIAEVQDAEISGSFEGDLIVRGRLIIYSTGRVRGNVTYGEIEIERGGQISGNIRNVADADSKAPSSSSRKAA